VTRRRDRGVALLLALLVLVILAILISQMTVTSLHNRTVADNHVADLQNTYGTRSGYHQAVLFLQADLETAADVDSLAERWAVPFPLDLGKARVEVVVRDSERAVNLAQLVNDKGEPNPTVVAQLRRLVRVLRHRPDVADRILDYVDKDTRGEFEARARNERLYNLEELLRVDGLAPEVLYGGTVDGDDRKGLLEFVTVWPASPATGTNPGIVNLNTAPAEVLQALSDEITPGAAEAIVAWRKQAGTDGKFQEFRSTEDLKKVPGVTDAMVTSVSGQVGVKSSTFEIRTRSKVGNIEKGWVFVVRRTGPSPGPPAPSPETGGGGGTTLVTSQRLNDFLSVKPPDEDRP
jgi:type II secretory pathway component PulK